MTLEKEKLLFDYGALLYDFDRSKDIFEKRNIIGKMNVINVILGVPKVEYKSPLLHLVQQENDIRKGN